jgi:hypothetical protein
MLQVVNSSPWDFSIYENNWPIEELIAARLKYTARLARLAAEANPIANAKSDDEN